MRGLGHSNERVANLYSGHEDEPSNTFKANIPEERINRRIQQAIDSYRKPSYAAMSLLVNEYLQNQPNMILKSSRDVAFFIGPRPDETKDKDAFREYRKVRATATRRVIDIDRERWVDAHSSESPPQVSLDKWRPTVHRPSISQECSVPQYYDQIDPRLLDFESTLTQEAEQAGETIDAHDDLNESREWDECWDALNELWTAPRVLMMSTSLLIML